jgi:hypothetical protein
MDDVVGVVECELARAGGRLLEVDSLQYDLGTL